MLKIFMITFNFFKLLKNLICACVFKDTDPVPEHGTGYNS